MIYFAYHSLASTPVPTVEYIPPLIAGMVYLIPGQENSIAKLMTLKTLSVKIVLIVGVNGAKIRKNNANI